MSMSSLPLAGSIFYPETDGQPMAENTRQFRWIVTLAGNLAALFRTRDDVFVSGNQFWYPVQGEPDIRTAPDVYVVFGRPRGDRGSCRQWEENDIPLTVTFEVVSSTDPAMEALDKHTFYDDHGVEEYYICDPESVRFYAHVRRGDIRLRMHRPESFVSPRLGIRFDLSGPELVVHCPDDRPFLTFEELAAERDPERRRAEEGQRVAPLSDLGRKVFQKTATPEVMQELQRLPLPPAGGSP